MKFLLQVRFNGADKVIGALPAREQQKVTDEFIAIRQATRSSAAPRTRCSVSRPRRRGTGAGVSMSRMQLREKPPVRSG